MITATARSYSRILGANDQIQIGQIDSGHRSDGHRNMLKLSSRNDPNFDYRSVCDIDFPPAENRSTPVTFNLVDVTEPW